MKTIFVIGTCDTKNEELVFLSNIIKENGLDTKIIDVSTKPNMIKCDVSNEQIAEFFQEGKENIFNCKTRGEAIENMSNALEKYFAKIHEVSGVIAIGGSGGTSLITPMMQQLPIGCPKIMVSTVASGDISSYVGSSDIMMMYSVVDFASMNSIMEKILTNAGNAISEMVKKQKRTFLKKTKKSLGITMFGVTTPCVEKITKKLEKQYECFVFHATGSGGKSFEKLVDSDLLEAVLDITTTEVCDLLMEGVFPCSKKRLDVFSRKKIPYFGSVGAIDMVNFGEIDTVPSKYKKRKLYIHNKQVTLMRTSIDENKKIGLWIANKLNKMNGDVRFFLPLNGLSLIDKPSQPFYDPKANEMLFKSIEENFKTSNKKKLIKINANINDDIFAEKIIDEFLKINS